MSRKSTEAKLTTISVQHRRVQPYDDLSPPVRQVWAELVNSLPANRFTASDRPLLALYCRALHQARLAFDKLEEHGAAYGNDLSPWLKVADLATKQSAVLATKLRLCPQSRLDRKTAGTAAAGPPVAEPWKSPNAEEIR